MANAVRDNNQITTMLGTSNIDGSTPIPIYANPNNHGILGDDGATGSDLSGDNATRDDNCIPVLLAVSSDDGITPVAVYTDPATGELLIQST